MTQFRGLKGIVLGVVLAIAISTVACAESLESIRKRLASASSRIVDLKGLMVINPSSRSNAAEISKGVLQFVDYGFQEITFYYKRPDRFRAEGKAKGIDVTYVLNGSMQQATAPAIMLKKTDDLSDHRGRKQSSLDIGFASDTLWNDNNVTLLSTSNGVAKLQLVPKGTRNKLHEWLWLDLKTLKVIKRERYNGKGDLKVRHIYLEHKKIGGVQIATLVKVQSSDGGYVGSITYENIKANTKLHDSLFAIK